MSEGDRTAEKSPVLCLQLSSLVPKNKASLHSTVFRVYCHTTSISTSSFFSLSCHAVLSAQQHLCHPIPKEPSGSTLCHHLCCNDFPPAHHRDGITKGHLLNIWRLNLAKETKTMVKPVLLEICFNHYIY